MTCASYAFPLGRADMTTTSRRSSGAVVRAGDWDLVHVQSYHSAVAPLAMLAALRAGLPYVVTFHGGGHSSRMRNAMRPLQWFALRPLLARARKLIAVAEFEAERFSSALRLPRERFVVIPNGSDLSAMPVTAERREQGKAADDRLGRASRALQGASAGHRGDARRARRVPRARSR